MMTIRGFLPAIVIALLAAIVIALLAAAVMDFNSGSTIANAINVGTSTTTNSDVPATISTTTTITSSSTSSRNLFELPLPFDSVNNECKRTCDNISQEGEGNESDNDTDFLINACPKCPERYSPCNYCCFDGASSLKLRFFGCPGTIEIVNNVSEQKKRLSEKNCGIDIDNDTNIDIDNNINSGSVYFVDCDCYDTAITITSSSSSSSYGDISSCPLYNIESLTYNSPDNSYFELCLVSAKRRPGERPVVDFSIPLPSVIGLEHIPYDDLASDEDDDSSQVTFFDTTCNEQVIGNHGSKAYPLGPGYGKFSGTCPNEGFIDFEQDDTPRLPDVIKHFNGEPPSTSFFYEFIDGTSVGFWKDEQVNNNDDDTGLFFESTFATCKCRDCSESSPTSDPTFESDIVCGPSTDGPTVSPVFPKPMPTPNPVGGSGIRPSLGTIEPTAGPSELPTPEPSFIPSTGSNIDMSNSPSTTTTTSPTGSTGSPSLKPKPTCSPNEDIIGVEPVMAPISVTASPTSTGSPTDSSSTSTTDGEDADDCDDCSQCFSFAIENCVNSANGSICTPQLSNGSRRFLNEKSEDHREFLIEEIEKHKLALDEALTELEKII